MPVGGFKWVENKSQFSKDFIENCNEDCDEGYFLEVNVQILKNYMTLIMICHFYLKEWKLKKLKNLYPTCMIRKNILYTQDI